VHHSDNVQTNHYITKDKPPKSVSLMTLFIYHIVYHVLIQCIRLYHVTILSYITGNQEVEWRRKARAFRPVLQPFILSHPPSPTDHLPLPADLSVHTQRPSGTRKRPSPLKRRTSKVLHSATHPSPSQGVSRLALKLDAFSPTRNHSLSRTSKVVHSATHPKPPIR
jgi:hypothetical protein